MYVFKDKLLLVAFFPSLPCIKVWKKSRIHLKLAAAPAAGPPLKVTVYVYDVTFCE